MAFLNHRRYGVALALAALALLLLAGCSSGESDNGKSAKSSDNSGQSMSSEAGDSMAAESGDQGPLKIGALVPLTGDLQAYGTSSRKGIELAVDEINSAGGVFGQDIELEVADDQTKPQPGTDAAKKLISVQGVSGIIGALSSGVTVPVAKSVTSKEGVLQISNASTTPVITDLDDNDFLFRTTPSDALQGTALAQVTQEKGLSKVGILYVNNAYGEGLMKTFTKAFEADGGKVTASAAVNKGNASYRGELSKVDTGGAEALVLITYPQTGTTILRQSLEGGYFDRFIFPDGMKAPEIIKAIGADALDGSFGTAPQAQTDTDAAQHFKSAYEKANGEVPPKPYIDTAYDAAYTMALAAEAAGSTDSGKIRDKLRDVSNPPGTKVGPGEWKKATQLLADGKDINYEGASGSVDYDDNGDVSGTFALWVIKDGKIETEKVFSP